MQYFPTIDLTPLTRMLLARGALRLQPGQWVRDGAARGRYLRTNPRTGVTYVSWVRPGDRLDDHVRRFHRACVKGFVGRYAALYDAAKAEREAARAARRGDARRGDEGDGGPGDDAATFARQAGAAEPGRRPRAA